MKKMKIAALATVMLFACGWAQTQAVTTVEGTLKLKDGDVAVESKDKTYFVPSLLRYSNFIDGIKEGAKVKVQGYVHYDDMLMPTSITVNGKTHNLSNSNSNSFGMRGDNYVKGGRDWGRDDCYGGGYGHRRSEYGHGGGYGRHGGHHGRHGR